MAYGIEMPGAPGVVPGRAAPRRGRRRWMVVLGVVLALLGLVSTIVGAITTFAFDAWASVSATAEGRVPDAVAFTADDTSYEVLLVRLRATNLDLEAAGTTCTVELADGRRLELDGRVQDVAVSGRGSATVGSFRAVAGRTVARCEGAEPGRTFVIDEIDDAERWSSRAMWIGTLVLLLGVGIGLLGWSWRRPAPRPADIRD